MVGYDDIRGREPLEPYCAGCERLEQEVDALEEKLAKAQKDSERLDWFETCPVGKNVSVENISGEGLGNWEIEYDWTGEWKNSYADTLREALDAAMKEDSP